MSGRTAEVMPQEEGRDLRVLFAAERTLLAWIRTGLTLMAFGFVVARFGIFLRMLAVASKGAPTSGHSAPVGVAFATIGALVVLAAAAEHFVIRRRFFSGEPLPLRLGALAIWLGLLVGLAGMGLAAFLMGPAPFE